MAEYKTRVISTHPDKCPDNERDKINEKFTQLQYAKDILIDPAKRRHYDAYLSLGSSMSLKEWMDNFEKLRHTLHWATNNDSPKMLDLPSKEIPENQKRFEGWTRHESDTVTAFRNYKI